MSQVDYELSGGATHFLLSHLSVKSTEWVLRREFPVAPSFQPSAVMLHYSDLDSAARKALHEHLRNVNGSEEDDMVNVNWGLKSCWKLHDRDEWFSFAVVLECLPIARALSTGRVNVPNPKPRVLYHLSTASVTAQTNYTLEYRMPISESFSPGTSSGSYLAMTYDTCDPKARRAIAQMVDHANRNQTDLLRKPWGLYSISRINPPKTKKEKAAAAAGANAQNVGLAIVMQWQPGDAAGGESLMSGMGSLEFAGSTTMDGAETLVRSPIPMRRFSRNMSGLAIALTRSHVHTPDILSHEEQYVQIDTLPNLQEPTQSTIEASALISSITANTSNEMLREMEKPPIKAEILISASTRRRPRLESACSLALLLSSSSSTSYSFWNSVRTATLITKGKEPYKEKFWEMHIFIGPLVHTLDRATIQYSTRSIVGVGSTGIIDFIVHDVFSDQLEDVLKALLAMEEYTAKGWSEATAKKIILTHGEFLLPGFIDTHTHAPQFPNISRGQQYELLDWLNCVTFPAEDRLADTEYAKKVYREVVKRVLSLG
ncbi:hypothetical protein FRC17_006706, partial [Serendipita sp. 399]